MTVESLSGNFQLIPKVTPHEATVVVSPTHSDEAILSFYRFKVGRIHATAYVSSFLSRWRIKDSKNPHVVRNLCGCHSLHLHNSCSVNRVGGHYMNSHLWKRKTCQSRNPSITLSFKKKAKPSATLPCHVSAHPA